MSTLIDLMINMKFDLTLICITFTVQKNRGIKAPVLPLESFRSFPVTQSASLAESFLPIFVKLFNTEISHGVLR